MTRIVLLCLTLMAGTVSSAAAQAGSGWDPTGLQLTRAELEALLDRYEEAANSPAYSRVVRERARSEAALVRQRLQDGDLRTGDRVVLIVERYDALTDTFTVGANRSIVLPEIGEVPLTGVLRAELQPHLAQHIARFIREPTVHARSLVRMEILGAVGTPGFYTVPSDLLLSDALMLAGGPSAEAAMDKVIIKRGAETIWGHERLREAVIEGRTLDQLSVRAGDSIVIPEKRSNWSFLRDGLLALSGLASLAMLIAQM